MQRSQTISNKNRIKEKPEKCQRKGCTRLAEKRVNKNLWYCIFHNKVEAVRETARARNKIVPSFDLVESLFLKTKNCTSCNREIDPFKYFARKDKRDGMATFQHNSDGTFSIFCLPCNVKDHALTLKESKIC